MARWKKGRSSRRFIQVNLNVKFELMAVCCFSFRRFVAYSELFVGILVFLNHFKGFLGHILPFFWSLREATAIGALENRKSKPQGRMKLPKIPTEVHQKTKRRLQKIPGIGGRLETKPWRGQADDKRVKIASNCGHVAKSNDDPIFNSNNKSNCNNNSSN